MEHGLSIRQAWYSFYSQALAVTAEQISPKGWSNPVRHQRATTYKTGVRAVASLEESGMLGGCFFIRQSAVLGSSFASASLLHESKRGAAPKYLATRWKRLSR